MSAVIEPPVETIDKHLEELDTVTIRFAGDSGDGMQLTGTQFTNTSAIVGNDISTRFAPPRAACPVSAAFS